MFVAVVRGRYSAGPEILDGEVEIAYESVRPEKRLAELAVLHDLFLRWYGKETALLRDRLARERDAMTRAQSPGA